MTTLLILAALGQFPHSRSVATPPAPPHSAAVADPPFVRRVIPANSWLPEPGLWPEPAAFEPAPVYPAADPVLPRVALAEPPVPGIVPPVTKADLDALAARVDRLASILAERSKVAAAAPAAPPLSCLCCGESCRCINPGDCGHPDCGCRHGKTVAKAAVGAVAPPRAAMPAISAPPVVHVLADRYGRRWDDSLSGWDGLVRYVESIDAAAPTPTLQWVQPPAAVSGMPVMSLGGYGYGAGACAGGSCALPSAGFRPFGGLFGGGFR